MIVDTVLKKIFGSKHERDIKAIRPLTETISSLEPSISKLTDSELTTTLQYRSLRSSILAVHEAGGLAIPAHPLVPYPLCAQGWILRRLLDDPDPAAHPDGLETFNPTSLGKPWHHRVVRFADQHGLARLGNSDAHALEAIGRGWTTFPGQDAADLRRAIETRTTDHGGTFHATAGQLGTFGQQLRKRSRDARDEVAGRVRRDGTGRDHGYPGGRQRPPRFDVAAVGDHAAGVQDLADVGEAGSR